MPCRRPITNAAHEAGQGSFPDGRYLHVPPDSVKGQLGAATNPRQEAVRDGMGRGASVSSEFYTSCKERANKWAV